jgi:hypothetical protein
MRFARVFGSKNSIFCGNLSSFLASRRFNICSPCASNRPKKPCFRRKVWSKSHFNTAFTTRVIFAIVSKNTLAQRLNNIGWDLNFKTLLKKLVEKRKLRYFSARKNPLFSCKKITDFLVSFPIVAKTEVFFRWNFILNDSDDHKFVDYPQIQAFSIVKFTRLFQ